MTDPTKQPLPPTSPLAAALDAPLGGTAQAARMLAKDHSGCPCRFTTPCHPMCPCVQSFSSRPCSRCCSWGSIGQRRRQAERLAAIIDAGNAASRQPPPPATVVLVRTLASHLHDLAMRTPADPDKIPGADSDDAACRMAYLYGHRDARHAIAEALIGHPALREPAPVAATGTPARTMADDGRRFSEAIMENMQRRWLDDEPTPKCFDASEDRAAVLLRFVGGTSEPTEYEEARTHLLSCVRCHFLYLTARDTERQPAPVAADGAGQGELRWMIQWRLRGGPWQLGMMTYTDKPQVTDDGTARVVPVRVSVLADDAGAAPAGAKEGPA